MSRTQKIVTIAISAMLVVLIFSFPGVRSAAADFLSIFRVNSIQTINITTADMNALEEAISIGIGQVDIEHFGRIGVVGNQDYVAVTMAEARQGVDFQLKLPNLDGFHLEDLYLVGDCTITMTLAVPNINAMLQAMGSNQLLPEDLDGQAFSLIVPAGVRACYENSDGSQQVQIMQAPSPELVTSSNLNTRQLRQALLSIPALPENLRNQLLAVDDLSKTLLIPTLDGSGENIIVNGSQGVLITSQANGAPEYIVVWQQNGVVNAITSDRLPIASLLDIAAKMK